MNELQIFKNDTFGEVRVAEVNGEPMFCLADVCKAIGIANSRNVKNRLDEDDVHQIDTMDNLGRTQQVVYVSESGLYDVILRSESPTAKPFRKWVTSEVLPSIRKTGGYMVTREDETNEELMARAILVANEAIKRRDERIAALQDQTSKQAEKIAEDRPKVIFANAIIESKGSCLIGELAKIITQNGVPIGQNRLFDWLREKGYLGTVGEYYNVPNQRYIEQGLFELKKGVRSGNDGLMYNFTTPKVTARGQQYFVNKFLAQNTNNNDTTEIF